MAYHTAPGATLVSVVSTLASNSPRLGLVDGIQSGLLEEG